MCKKNFFYLTYELVIGLSFSIKSFTECIWNSNRLNNIHKLSFINFKIPKSIAMKLKTKNFHFIIAKIARN